MTQRDRTASGRFRILAIANETVDGDAFHQLIVEHANGHPSDVLVVAPALNSRFRHWFSDEDGARAAAEERLEHSIERLQALGIAAYGGSAMRTRSTRSPTRSLSSRPMS
jgi:hypothetical protein